MGIVFNIQRFSLNDGPGIRTTVFLKGCNLRCGWCHNPEGLEKQVQLQYLKNKCINCGRCYSECENDVHDFTNNEHNVDFTKCVSCFKCTEVCPTQALVKNGENITSDVLVEQLLKDKEYYENGGVTFSGGEPMLQNEFIKEVSLKLKKEHIHIAVDTACNVPFEYFIELKDVVDLFLIDVKAITPKLHIENIGVDNNLILDNIKKIDDLNIPIWIRVPVIGCFNNNINELNLIKDFINTLKNVQRVTVIPYHSLGYEKYDSIGMKSKMLCYKEINDSDLNEYKKILEK